MSTAPSAPKPPKPFDPSPYYTQAAACVEASIKRWGQYSMIEQAEAAWGKMHLHSMTDRNTGLKVFEIVVQEAGALAEVRDQIAAHVVGEAICQGESPLLAGLRSSPKALAALAERHEPVDAILEKLELDKSASAPNPETSSPAPRPRL